MVAAANRGVATFCAGGWGWEESYDALVVSRRALAVDRAYC